MMCEFGRPGYWPANKQKMPLSSSHWGTVDYAETLLSSENPLSFTFYKPNAAAGKTEIEPNGEGSRGLSVPARFALAIPIIPEE